MDNDDKKVLAKNIGDFHKTDKSVGQMNKTVGTALENVAEGNTSLLGLYREMGQTLKAVKERVQAWNKDNPKAVIPWDKYCPATYHGTNARTVGNWIKLADNWDETAEYRKANPRAGLVEVLNTLRESTGDGDGDNAQDGDKPEAPVKMSWDAGEKLKELMAKHGLTGNPRALLSLLAEIGIGERKAVNMVKRVASKPLAPAA